MSPVDRPETTRPESTRLGTTRSGATDQPDTTAQPSKRKARPLAAEAWIFGGLMIFFMIVAPAYYLISKEPAGGVALTLAGLLNAILFVYLLLIGRELGRTRPEDDHDGEIVHGAGELGFFPPKSIWPFWCAVTITIVFLGPVFGWWISLLGIGLGIWAASGMIFEYYRGDYAH